MLISEIEMYEMLREKMSEKEATALVLYIENRVDHKFVDAQAIFGTKTDVATINESIAKINENLLASIHKNELKIAESKTDLLKWLFGLILGSTVAIIGTVLAVMKMGG